MYSAILELLRSAIPTDPESTEALSTLIVS